MDSYHATKDSEVALCIPKTVFVHGSPGGKLPSSGLFKSRFIPLVPQRRCQNPLAHVTDQRTVTLTKLLLSLAERMMARQVIRTGHGPRIEGDPSKPCFDALQMEEEAVQLSRNIIRASRGRTAMQGGRP
jgi:hypothetical protein